MGDKSAPTTQALSDESALTTQNLSDESALTTQDSEKGSQSALVTLNLE